MPETKLLIPTQTYTQVQGSTISITTMYLKEGVSNVMAFINEIVGGQIVQGTTFLEGEGGVLVQNISSNLVFSKDPNGNLIISGQDSSKYSIDTMTGQLVYSTD